MPFTYFSRHAQLAASYSYLATLPLLVVFSVTITALKFREGMLLVVACPELTSLGFVIAPDGTSMFYCSIVAIIMSPTVHSCSNTSSLLIMDLPKSALGSSS